MNKYSHIIVLFCAVISAFLIPYSYLPWYDEVVQSDTPINFLKLGAWDTFTWQDSSGDKPFCTYQPLWQILLIPWMFVFGVSSYSIKMFNLFVFTIFVCLLLHLLKKYKIITDLYCQVSLVVLLFFSYSSSYLFNNGRVEPVTLLMLLIFVIDYISNWENRDKPISWRRYLKTIVTSALLLLSGLQILPLLVISCMVLLVMYWPDKFFFLKYISVCGVGFVLSFVCMSLFQLYNDNLISYYAFIITGSGMIKKIVAYLLPYMSSLFPDRIDGWMERSNDVWEQKSDNMFMILIKCKEFFVASIVSGLFFILYWKNIVQNRKKSKLVLSFFLITVLHPFFLAYTGKLPPYYYSFIFIPILIFFVMIMQKYLLQMKYVLLIFSLSYASYGISMKNWDLPIKYAAMEAMVDRLDLKREDAVVTVNPLYYILKEKVDSCYIYLYNPQYASHNIKYLFCEFPVATYLEDHTSYEEMLLKKGKQLIAVDSIDSPKIIVYKVVNGKKD